MTPAEQLASLKWQTQQLEQHMAAVWRNLTTAPTTAEVRKVVLEQSTKARQMLREAGLPEPQ